MLYNIVGRRAELCEKNGGVVRCVYIVNKIFKRRNSNREQNEERTSIEESTDQSRRRRRLPSPSVVGFCLQSSFGLMPEDPRKLVLRSISAPTTDDMPTEEKRPKQSKQAKSSTLGLGLGLAQPLSLFASSPIVFRYPVRPTSAHLRSYLSIVYFISSTFTHQVQLASEEREKLSFVRWRWIILLS